MSHKERLGRDSSNSRQASIERSICICFISSSYRKWSSVGPVVPKPAWRNKDGEVIFAHKLCGIKNRAPTVRWLPRSDPAVAERKKGTCMAAFSFYVPPLPPCLLLLSHPTSVHTHTCIVQRDENKADVGSVFSTGS